MRIIVATPRRFRAAAAEVVPAGDIVLPTHDMDIAKSVQEYADRHAIAAIHADRARVDAPADQLHDALRDRHRYQDIADQLAHAIGKYFGVDVGGPSILNRPCYVAPEVIHNATAVPAAAFTLRFPGLRRLNLSTTFATYQLARDYASDAGSPDAQKGNDS